jgi:hypothetical protein
MALARECSFWRHYVDYFPIKLIKTVEIDSSKNYLLCVHPHGTCFFTEILTKIECDLCLHDHDRRIFRFTFANFNTADNFRSTIY